MPRGGAADVDRAVAAAAAAFPAWRALPARDRGLLLARIADDLADIGEELARIIAAETGNAIRTQARGEAATSADVFRYFGGVASEQKGEVLPLGDEHAQLQRARAARRGRGDRALERARPARLAEGRDGAVHRQHARAQGRRGRAARRAADGRGLRARTCPPACSTWSPATARSAAARCSTTPASRRSPSPARPRSGGSRCAPPPSGSCPCRSSSAARPRRSSTRTPTTTPPSRTSSPRCASRARASRARPARGCTSTGASSTTSSRGWCEQLDELVVGDALDERSDIGSIVSGTQDGRVCGYVREALDQGATAIAGGLPDDTRPGYQHAARPS